MSERRLGLALSGGGFRASFFHIGVLARMAELDLLRDVESISTVSGGSIIGALYYLRLKNLLESKADNEITQQDYIDLVQGVEQEFSAAVKKNIRWYTFSSIKHNLKMMLPHYSRSDRIGELYDELIYRHAWANERDTPIMMDELKIYPQSDKNDKLFNPTKGHNQARVNKVPVLNINATVLNTGHDWRFTASQMGEVVHDDDLALNIDKNTRLKGGRYEDLNQYCAGFPLGKAVAASACVPGLFPPLTISHMYDSSWRIELVDGGVYDNQGIEALRDPNHTCTHMIISDACGQMRDAPSPLTRAASVFMRVTEVLMGRVREEMIGQTVRKHGEEKIAFMHMTEGLPVMFKPHLDNQGHAVEPPRRPVKDPRPDLDLDTRGRIARIRTDLDSFTDVEAKSIMAVGYAFANVEIDAFKQHWNSTEHTEQKGHWQFSVAEAWLKDPQKGPENYSAQLDVAEQKFFKPFYLGFNAELAKATGLCLLSVFAMLLLVWGVAVMLMGDPLTQLMQLLKSVTALDLIIIALVVVVMNLLGRLGKVIKYLRLATRINQTVVKLVIEALVPALAAIPVKVYLLTIDKYFQKMGEYKEGADLTNDEAKNKPEDSLRYT